MKTDTYTETILTIIALFLGILATENIYTTTVPTAEASTSNARWECNKAKPSSISLQADIGEYATKMNYSQMTITAAGGGWYTWCGLTTQPKSE